MTEPRRVVITGLGMVSPLGIGWRDAWRAALEGRACAGPITRFDTTGHACRIACEVGGFDPEEFIDRRAARRMDRVSQMAVAAARLALEDAELTIDGNGDRAGTVIATGNGGSEAFEDNDRALLERGADRASPLMVPMAIVNMSAGHVSMQLGLKGPASCVVTACASGNHGIGDAAAIIRRGAAEVMLAGGAEAGVTPYCMASLDATRALSRRSAAPAIAQARPRRRAAGSRRPGPRGWDSGVVLADGRISGGWGGGGATAFTAAEGTPALGGPAVARGRPRPPCPSRRPGAAAPGLHSARSRGKGARSPTSGGRTWCSRLSTSAAGPGRDRLDPAEAEGGVLPAPREPSNHDGRGGRGTPQPAVLGLVS